MKTIWVVVLAVMVASVPGELLARGGRGGGGGGARGFSGGGGAREFSSGGGGNFHAGGGGGNRAAGGGGFSGGGGMSRSTGHAPSFSQPSGGAQGGANRFGGGGAGTGTRPAGGGGERFGAGGAGERFGAGGAGERFAGGGAAAGTRPADGFRPNEGNTFNRAGNNNFANRSGNFNNAGNRNFNNISGNNINVNRAGGYGGYGGWYHGNWHPNAGWNGGGYRPWGWGWGGSGFGWGVGAGLATAGLFAAVSPWNWGYYGYSNPYWNGGGSSYINYSQPIVASAPLDTGLPLADDGTAPDPSAIADASAAPGPTTDQDQAMAIFEGARGQFTAGDYAGALAATESAIKLQSNDPVLHEFRALCLFAEGEYQQSAAAIYAVLSGGPGWDWTTVSSLYPGVMVYTQQLRALEKYSREHPDAADARFLLAYQYLLTGHNDAASAELKQVVALEPNDALSAQLLKSISPAADGTAPGAAPAPASVPSGKPIDASALVGDWTAGRPDGTKVEMDLTGAKQFTWRFAQGGKPQELKGTYTLADNYLVLKASQQNALVGQVGLLANNQLSFRLADDNPADPGLVFKK